MAPKKRGVFADTALTDKVADFSYQNDSLAQMIVEAWVDSSFKDDLTMGAVATRVNNARTALADRGIYLQHPIVITEAEYEGGHPLSDPNGVVFVLPNKPRTGTPPAHQSLLETAKLLMACTPNGI